MKAPFVTGRPLSERERETPRDLADAMVAFGRELRALRWRRRMRRYEVEGTPQSKERDQRTMGERE